MPLKIISGGQTGADIAGLKAAKFYCLRTGGTMPRGWLTLDGPKPEYEQLYGMVQHATSSYYPPRTYDNVKNSDTTIRFFTKRNSPGEVLTLKACRQYKKPFIDVDLTKAVDYLTIVSIIKWLKIHKVKVLNVSGNSEQTSPGIEHDVRIFMEHVLAKYS